MMVKTVKSGVIVVKKNWKSQIAKVTGANRKLDQKVLQLKKSWDEVSGLLNIDTKKKKK
jgi:hypothetical protein